ncbi:MAG: hypothetical protein ABSA83_00525 [Verrucomicrobiota bacterium]
MNAINLAATKKTGRAWMPFALCIAALLIVVACDKKEAAEEKPPAAVPPRNRVWSGT